MAYLASENELQESLIESFPIGSMHTGLRVSISREEVTYWAGLNAGSIIGVIGKHKVTLWIHGKPEQSIECVSVRISSMMIC